MSLSHLFVATLIAAVVLVGPKLLPGKHDPDVTITQRPDAADG